jgi:DNA polymerase II large subunit
MPKKPEYEINHDRQLDSNQDITLDDSQESSDEFNQDEPNDFPQEAYEEYKEGHEPDDFTQYEAPTLAERAKSSVKKKR